MSNLIERKVRDEQRKETTLQIEGGVPLIGRISEIGGGKNISYALMFASCLPDSPSVLTNIPVIGDVSVARKMLGALGAKIQSSEDRGTMLIDPSNVNNIAVPRETGEASRASIVIAGALLGKFGEARVPLPGGDKLGRRDIDIYVDGLMAFGATVDSSEQNELIFLAPEGLFGCEYSLRLPSLTATETLILAAAKAKGRTILHNTAVEPEVDELMTFLNKGGAKMQRIFSEDNTPTRTVVIDGVSTIQGVEHHVSIDRNAVVTYAVAAIATESQEGIFVEDAQSKDIQGFLNLLDEMGGGYVVEDGGIRFYYREPLRAPKRTVVTSHDPCKETDTEIGIASDWQPLVSVLLLKASGASRIVETVFEQRFNHLFLVQERGSTISFYNPVEDDLSVDYCFQKSEENYPHGAIIHGEDALRPIDLEGNDIRLGAFGILVGVSANGMSTIKNTNQINRGYHKLVANLQKTGARIQEI